MGVKSWFLILREEHRLSVREYADEQSVLGSKGEDKEQTVRNCPVRIFVIFTPLQAILNKIKGKR
jgi:hypothetical protein